MYRIHAIARKMVIICMLSIAGLLFFPLAAQSADVLRSSVTRQDDRYLMHMETVVQAPISKVHSLLKDYKNFTRFNSIFKQVKLVGNLDGGGVRMGVRSEFCILVICQHFDWIQDVQFLPDGNISITIVPDQGDFRQGNGHWRLFPVEGGTRLSFDLDLTPKYWIPPVFGMLLAQKKFSEDVFKFAQELERMAVSKDC
jgi:ribosome-associated toxin RatA of RatAB toxin-antitoxin module